MLQSPLEEHGARRLIVATVLQAVYDARNGNAEAVQWLLADGCDWLEIVGEGGVAFRLRSAAPQRCSSENAGDAPEPWECRRRRQARAIPGARAHRKPQDARCYSKAG